jgi:hypothetical protein
VRDPGSISTTNSASLRLLPGALSAATNACFSGGGLHRQTRRRIKRRVRFQERHKCLSRSMVHLITSSQAKFQGIVQPIPSRRQGHSKLNFIRAKWLAARTEIVCARNLASRLVALSHPIQRMKRPVARKVAHRNVSSVREKSAQSKDKRRP